MIAGVDQHIRQPPLCYLPFSSEDVTNTGPAAPCSFCYRFSLLKNVDQGLGSTGEELRKGGAHGGTLAINLKPDLPVFPHTYTQTDDRVKEPSNVP